MAEVFTWQPIIEPSGDFQFRTREARFGDGYGQAVGDGLNNEVQTWPLTFRGSLDYLLPIRDFLRAHGGHTSFLWTPPDGEQALFRCKGFQWIPGAASRRRLVATFDQWFTP